MEHSLVDRLLEAILNPQEMAETLRLAASAFSADHLVAFVISPQTTSAFSSRGTEEIVQALVAEDWHHKNPRLLRGLEHARSGKTDLITDWRLFTPEEYAREPFEHEFASKYDLRHYAGNVIPFGSDAYFVLSFERGRSKGAFAGYEERRLNAFLNEITRSVRHTLRGQAHLAGSLIDSFSLNNTAHAWVDSAARLRHASSAFAGLMGRFLGERNGRLTPLAGNREPFHDLIAFAAKGQLEEVVIELRNPLESLDVAFCRAIPLRGVQLLASAQADVLLSVEVSSSPRTDLSKILSNRYDLTPAEIRLVTRLGEGKSLRQAAEAENISYESARTRLKAIFNKMSVSRQADLIRRICAL